MCSAVLEKSQEDLVRKEDFIAQDSTLLQFSFLGIEERCGKTCAVLEPNPVGQKQPKPELNRSFPASGWYMIG